MEKSLSNLLLMFALAVALASFSCTSKHESGNETTLPQEVATQLDTSSMRVTDIVNRAIFAPKNTSVNATIDVTCGGHTYTISTGNNNGSCVVDWDRTRRVTGGSCTDSGTGQRGNDAAVDCRAGCLNAFGSGTCTKKN